MTMAVVEATPYSILYSCTEDGTAAAAETRDILADLTAQGVGSGNPLFDDLNDAFLSQAAARADFVAKCDPIVHMRSSTPAGATSAPALTVDEDISGGVVVGNFRLVVNVVKAANGDTALFFLRVSYRHSIID